MVGRMREFAWIPIVLIAAAAQTVRNAAQRSLTESAGTVAATSVRFLFGLPFAAAALACADWFAGHLPQTNPRFFLWVSAGALAQLIATALLLAAMRQRSFIVVLAYSKTEVLQIVLFSILFLGESVSALGALAIVAASTGLLFLSLPAPGDTAPAGWFSTAALYGVGSGAGFALSAVGYRGAALALGNEPAWLAGAFGLVWAQVIQCVLIGSILLVWHRGGFSVVLREWRTSILAGFCGAAASFGWFTAFALRNAADVRTLALIEVLYGYLVSRRIFGESLRRAERLGLILLVAGIALITAQW
jgi:drug/metabolite transporter (DMT)-like permease